MVSLNKLNPQDLNFCPYQVLELPPFTSDLAVIKKAFRKLALVWHPDRNPTRVDIARDKFERVKLASEILLSPTLRVAYDAYLRVKEE